MNIQIFEKLIEIITPSFNRKKYQERHLRLKNFFEERRRIENLNESDEIKYLLLNSAISALTGTKYANIDELDYFLDKFKGHDFENLYWAFVWNRFSYGVVKNSKGKVLSLKPTNRGKRNTILLNVITILSMSLSPFLLRDQYNKIQVDWAPLSTTIIQTVYAFVCAICLITIIKVIHDWYHWNRLNQIIET